MFVELLLSPDITVETILDSNEKVIGLKLVPSFVSARATEKICQIKSVASNGAVVDNTTLLLSGATGLFKKQPSSVKIVPKFDTVERTTETKITSTKS